MPFLPIKIHQPTYQLTQLIRALIRSRLSRGPAGGMETVGIYFLVLSRGIITKNHRDIMVIYDGIIPKNHDFTD